MIIPVRCMSCGTPLSGKWEEFQKQVKAGKNPKNVLDSLGLKRYCCRALFISHVDLIDDIAKFKRG